MEIHLSELTQYGFVGLTELVPPVSMGQGYSTKPLIFRVEKLGMVTIGTGERTEITVEGIGMALVEESVAEVCGRAGAAWGAIK